MSPFSSVVIGVDGAEGGRDAVALAQRLVAGAEQVTLVHVNVLEPLSAVVIETARDETIRRELAGLAGRLGDALPGARIATRSPLAHTVAEGLRAVAVAQEADLVVVGSSRRGRMARILLGDDTREVLRCSPCTVAIAPAGIEADGAAGPLRRIGVGYGTDAASERALGLARRLRPEDGTLALVHMEDEPVLPLPRAAIGVYSVADREAAREAAARAVAALDDVDEARGEVGEVADGLLELARDVDLLVVGLHHRSPVGRLLHGSSAAERLRELPCPLLAVPEG